MSITEILKNLHNFYEEVLPKAFCSPNHNEESIANAFLWADFTEKLYKRLNEENLQELQKQLKASKYVKDENFKQCTSLLCHAFLQNPSIDKNNFESIISKIKPSGLNQTEVWKDAVELDSLCIQLLESLRRISFTNSDCSFYHEVKSELLLDFLNNLAEQLPTEEQLETCVSLILETLCTNHDGMMVLLHALLSTGHEAFEIQEFSVHWILSKFLENSNCPLACLFWNQSPCILRKIAVRHPAFCSYYFEHLMQSAFILHCTSERNSEQCERKTGNDKSLSYGAVVKHFRNLLSCDDATAQATRNYLETQIKQKNFTIWKDIMSPEFSNLHQ